MHSVLSLSAAHLDLPNSPAAAPPGLAVPVGTLIGWAKWCAAVVILIGLLIGVARAVGSHRHGEDSSQAVMAVLSAVGGLIVVAAAVAIVNNFS